MTYEDSMCKLIQDNWYNRLSFDYLANNLLPWKGEKRNGEWYDVFQFIAPNGWVFEYAKKSSPDKYDYAFEQLEECFDALQDYLTYLKKGYKIGLEIEKFYTAIFEMEYKDKNGNIWWYDVIRNCPVCAELGIND